MRALVTRATRLAIVSPLANLMPLGPSGVPVSPGAASVTYASPVPNVRRASAYVTYVAGAPGGQLLLTASFDPNGIVNTFFNELSYDPALNVVGVFDERKFFLGQRLSPVVAAGVTIRFVWEIDIPAGLGSVRITFTDLGSLLSTLSISIVTAT